MSDPADIPAVVEAIRARARGEDIRLTQHAQQEMVEEAIPLEDVLEALASCELLEDYPDHRRGPCGLVLGYTVGGRPLHIVCTTAASPLIVVTVYEPRPPKWTSPTRRGRR